MAKVQDAPIRVGFIGNPNCGKTTLFNAITGAKLKVANWPGVTVEKVEGSTVYHDQEMKLIDLPGIYSLTSYTMEEIVSRNCILSDEVDVVVNVVDASCMERNLYLTMQLVELGKPIVVALNMMDIVEERGMEIDLHRLPEMLGDVPVVPVSARKRTGLDTLMHAVVHHFREREEQRENVISYSDDIEQQIAEMETALTAEHPDWGRTRWYAIKLLEHDGEVLKQVSPSIAGLATESLEKEIIQEKYAYIEEVIQDTLLNREEKAMRTERIDRWLTHRIWGLPIFLGIMLLVFALTFLVGDFLKGYFEQAVEALSGWVTDGLLYIHAADWIISLVADGIIAGVGGILTFLPNIFILFLALAVLEDSGYMARVAYVMDGIMSRLGMSGKAFLPMILGFGCSVPAIMATRALEREKDRRKLMMVIPFMSCSARVPVYVLFAGIFFGRYAFLVSFSMYVLGLAIAILVAKIVTVIQKSSDNTPLLIELPEYKSPNARTIAIYVWEKIKDYLTKAGTVIFVASIILWFILNFGISGKVDDVSLSFGSMIGKWLVPIMAPAGLGMWQVVVALISGLSAKEVVVSSFAVLYGVSNINSDAGMTQLSQMLAAQNFGMLNAYCLMLFVLLYTPCIATIATIRSESHSWKFTGKVLLLQLLIAWLAATIVFQIGSLF